MLALFCLQLAALDLVVRGPRFYLAHPRALSFFAASAAVLFLASRLARRRALRLAIAVTLALVLVGQLAFFLYYRAPIDDRIALAARQSWADVRPILAHAAPQLVAGVAVIAATEYILLARIAARSTTLRAFGSRSIAAAFAVFAVAAAIGGAWRDGTLELRAAHAAVALAITPPIAKTKVDRHALPPLVSRRRTLPDVLFVVTESVRASDDCVGIDGCALATETNAALPEHVTFSSMRAIASYTAISMSAILTGHTQVGSRAPIVAAPDLFDYLRATRGQVDRPTVHYWSSQSPSFFERDDVARVVDSFISADTLLGRVVEDDGDAIMGGLDREVARACDARFPRLAPPYLTLVHFVGTHAPYFFDDAAPPFTPFDRTISFSTMTGVHAAYKDAIVEQDRSIARCVRAFVDAQRGRPFLIVLTSDHGEAFGEHGAIHHGQNLYDEQIVVPGVVAWGNGALDDDERRALIENATRPATHLDLLPTLLDAFGVLDHFAISKEREAMSGQSLFRPRSPTPAPIPITNCSEMWQCTLEVWGMLAGDRKLVAQPWDNDWRCLELEGGEHLVDRARCDDLAAASRRYFEKLPNGNLNR